ncbi:MAG: MFS transporter [Spirochaetota bacterium]
MAFTRDLQYKKFSLYGFLKNLRFFDPYLLLFFREMGLSFTLIGVLFSIREIVTNVMEIPSGIIADSFGRRKSMVFCFISYIISFALFFAFPHFWVFAIAMVFFAFGEAFRTGTHKAMIMEYLKIHGMTEQKTDYYGHTRGWSQTGSALSAILAALMVVLSGGYRIVFLLSIIPYLFGLFLMLSYPRELDFSVDDGEMPPERPPARRWKHQFVQSFKGLAELFRAKELRRGILNFSIFDGIFKSTKDYLQPIIEQTALAMPVLLYLEGEERSAILIGLVYMVLYLLTSFASRSAGTLKNRVQRTELGLNLLFSAGAVLMIATAAAHLAGLSYLAIATFIIYYMIQNLRRPLSVEYVSDRVKGSVMATGLSGESQLKTLITAAAAPLFGFLVDTQGLGETLLIFGIVMLLLSSLLKVKSSSATS